MNTPLNQSNMSVTVSTCSSSWVLTTQWALSRWSAICSPPWPAGVLDRSCGCHWQHWTGPPHHFQTSIQHLWDSPPILWCLRAGKEKISDKDRLPTWYHNQGKTFVKFKNDSCATNQCWCRRKTVIVQCVCAISDGFLSYTPNAECSATQSISCVVMSKPWCTLFMCSLQCAWRTIQHNMACYCALLCCVINTNKWLQIWTGHI